MCSFSSSRVTRERDDLHAVEQRRMDRPQLVGRGDEEHARQIHVDLEVVVAERVILRRVEHLEQRRRGIPLEAGADLVDLVEHEHGVHRARLFERLDDSARDGADVGAPVPPDLGLVANPAQRDSDELAVHGPRNRVAERGLPDAGRADKAEDRPFDRRRIVGLGRPPRLQLLDRKVFDNPLLDLVEIVVILVEHLARGHRIEAVLADGGPGHVEDPVDVRADHLILGRRRRHPLQTIDLTSGDGQHRFGQLGVGQPGPQFLRFGLLPFAQLVLNGLELLPQEVLPLRVGHLLLGGAFDLALQLEQGDLAVEGRRHRLQLHQQTVALEDLLLLLRLHVDQAGQEIGEP